MIYLHVPFCRTFCSYCAFYSLRGASAENVRRYVEAVGEEIARRDAEIRRTQDISTLYIGGGTPSVLPLSVLEDLVRPLLAFGPFSEWTVELNPDDVTPEYAAGLRSLGVSRVSVGVQSLDDGQLRWMHRRHDAASALRALRTLREAGFDNVSADLIFGCRKGDGDALERTLDGLLSFRPEHLSAYQLSLDGGSALEKAWRTGRYVPVDDEEAEARYLRVCRRLGEAGYEHYEISNFCLPGFRARHNGAYWTRSPYVGLGPAAHSFDGRVRSWHPDSLRRYLAGTGDGREVLDGPARRTEEVMLGLRTADGVPSSLLIPSGDVSGVGGTPAADGASAAAARRLLAQGRLEKSRINGNLRIPEKYFFISNTLISQLL